MTLEQPDPRTPVVPAAGTPPVVPVPALSLRGLAKRLGAKFAVDGLGMDVPAGSFYGIVGPNGAGKTTCPTPLE